MLKRHFPPIDSVKRLITTERRIHFKAGARISLPRIEHLLAITRGFDVGSAALSAAPVRRVWAQIKNEDWSLVSSSQVIGRRACGPSISITVYRRLGRS
jgi:hypothetical protein